MATSPIPGTFKFLHSLTRSLLSLPFCCLRCTLGINEDFSSTVFSARGMPDCYQHTALQYIEQPNSVYSKQPTEAIVSLLSASRIHSAVLSDSTPMILKVLQKWRPEALHRPTSRRRVSLKLGGAKSSRQRFGRGRPNVTEAINWVTKEQRRADRKGIQKLEEQHVSAEEWNHSAMQKMLEDL